MKSIEKIEAEILNLNNEIENLHEELKSIKEKYNGISSDKNNDILLDINYLSLKVKTLKWVLE